MKATKYFNGSGLYLAEIVIALAILSLALVCTMGVFVGFNIEEQNKIRITQMNLAKAKMEEIISYASSSDHNAVDVSSKYHGQNQSPPRTPGTISDCADCPCCIGCPRPERCNGCLCCQCASADDCSCPQLCCPMDGSEGRPNYLGYTCIVGIIPVEYDGWWGYYETVDEDSELLRVVVTISHPAVSNFLLVSFIYKP